MQTPKLHTFLLAFLFCTNVQAATLDSTPVEILRRVDQLPSFPGGKEALFDFIAENIHTPASTAEHKIHGQVIVKFVVYKDGQIGDVGIIKGLDSLADQEAQRLVKSMPKWTPGKHKGQPVNVEMGLPIRFEFLAELDLTKKDMVLKELEKVAQFVGGENAMLKYIATELEYPKHARDNKIQGDVVAQFLVEKDGSIVSPAITSGLGYGIDEEVIRVIRKMPKWEPSQLNGEPVRTLVTNLKVILRIY